MVSPPPAALSDRGFPELTRASWRTSPCAVTGPSGASLPFHAASHLCSLRRVSLEMEGPGRPERPSHGGSSFQPHGWEAGGLGKPSGILHWGKPHATCGAGERRPPRVPSAFPAALLESGLSGHLPGLGGQKSPSPAPCRKPTGTTLTLFLFLLSRYYEIKKQP